MGIVWTLRARGLLPSLGAGGSLVVAALCCLLLATALISFRDWPGRGESPPVGTIAMPAPPSKAAGRAASGPAAPAAAVSAPVADRRAAEGPARRGATRRAAPGRPAPAGTNPPAAAPAPPVAAPPAASSPAASSPAGTTPAQQAPATQPEPARRPGTAEGVVEDVRRVQEPLPLPPAVREPVEPVLDTVQQVGRTVDETTAPLLPALP